MNARKMRRLPPIARAASTVRVGRCRMAWESAVSLSDRADLVERRPASEVAVPLKAQRPHPVGVVAGIIPARTIRNASGYFVASCARPAVSSLGIDRFPS